MPALSLILNPDDTINPRVLTPAELTAKNQVLGAERIDVIRLDDGVDLWVDEDYLDRPRDEFNAAATFLSHHYGFRPPSLRGPALLCAVNDDGTAANLAPTTAVHLRALIAHLLNN